MKVCQSCGRENADDAAACSACGNAFLSTLEVPPIPLSEPSLTTPPPLPVSPLATSPVSPQTKVLQAGTATLILAIYFGAQLVGGLIGGVVAGVIGATGQDDASSGAALGQTVMALIVMLAVVAGGIAMIMVSISLLRDQLRDTSATGAAWVAGSSKHIRIGFGVGILVAIGYCGLAIPFQDEDAGMGPVTKMALTPGLSQISWLLLATLVAPPVEELLFRGLLYGGYRKSFGPVAAAISTTLIFTLLHITEIVHSWPAAIAIIGLALTALWARLRFAAIGPAIAAHFGYNSVMALITVLQPLPK